MFPRDSLAFGRAGCAVGRCETVHGVVQDFMAVNLAHGQLRRRLVTPDKMSLVEETVGKQGAEHFLDSGITGVTPGKVGAHTRVRGACERTPHRWHGQNSAFLFHSTLPDSRVILDKSNCPSKSGTDCSNILECAVLKFFGNGLAKGGRECYSATFLMATPR